jgi:hypothetical protein
MTDSKGVFDLHVVGTNYNAYLAATENNDFSKVIALLRDSDVEIEKYVRELVASKLEGSFKGKRGPPANSAATKDKIVLGCHCYLWLTIIKKWPKDAAKEKTAEVMGVTKKTVNNWLKEPDKPLERMGRDIIRSLFETVRDDPDFDSSDFKPEPLGS